MRKKKKDLHKKNKVCFEPARVVNLLDPIKLDGQLKLTASAFNRLWTSMVTVPTVTQNSLQPLSAFSIVDCHLLGFMEQGKITEADAPTICLDGTPSGLSVPPGHLHRPPIITPNALSVATLPIYPALGQARNNVGLHTQWLGG